jgi:hypothetical protein
MFKRILQNYWNRGLTIKTNKNEPIWSQDLKLMSWNSLTLFDEYLEMGKIYLINKHNLTKIKNKFFLIFK